MEGKQRLREKSRQKGREGNEERKIKLTVGKMKVCMFHIFLHPLIFVMATQVDFISRLLRMPLKLGWECKWLLDGITLYPLDIQCSDCWIIRSLVFNFLRHLHVLILFIVLFTFLLQNAWFPSAPQLTNTCQFQSLWYKTMHLEVIHYYSLDFQILWNHEFELFLQLLFSLKNYCSLFTCLLFFCCGFFCQIFWPISFHHFQVANVFHYLMTFMYFVVHNVLNFQQSCLFGNITCALILC